MANEKITIEEIHQFLLEHDKVTGEELVKHFKKYLHETDKKDEARKLFKEHVNTLTTCLLEDGTKYLILKQKYQKSLSKSYDSKDDQLEKDILTGKRLDRKASSDITHSQSSPSIFQSSLSSESSGFSMPSPSVHHSASCPQSFDSNRENTPQPPPRRKNLLKNKENRGTKIEERVRQLSEEKEASPKKAEIKELVVSPGNVKEKAEKLNRMASESELNVAVLSSHNHKKIDNKLDKVTEDDASSTLGLHPKRKEWMVTASKADYHQLFKLLKEESNFSNYKDIHGYTALHFAAKHGNLNVIKLMAGTYKVNPNIKTHGGYTPLHLAAMFGREEIMEILISSYGADPNIRDNSGKKPHQYLPTFQAERFVSIFPEIANRLYKINVRTPEKEQSFIRIGSLNTKVKKTAAALTGGKGLARMKSWGSADNLSGVPSTQLMPPPKFIPKKKKKRINDSLKKLRSSESSKNKSADSDSDSTSGLTL